MNKFCSIFSQLLQLFPRYEFQKLVKISHAERHAPDGPRVRRVRIAPDDEVAGERVGLENLGVTDGLGSGGHPHAAQHAARQAR